VVAPVKTMLNATEIPDLDGALRLAILTTGLHRASHLRCGLDRIVSHMWDATDVDVWAVWSALQGMLFRHLRTHIRVPYAHHISKTRLQGERDINMKLNVRFLGQIA